MDVGIAFLAGLFIGSILGFFIIALAIAAGHEEEWLEQMDRGSIDGKNDKG